MAIELKTEIVSPVPATPRVFHSGTTTVMLPAGRKLLIKLHGSGSAEELLDVEVPGSKTWTVTISVGAVETSL
jgi:hypothetical protein